MVANHLQAPSFLPSASTAGPISPPPFWELEDLLGQGLQRSIALDVMAARRRRPILVALGSRTGRPGG